MDVRIESPRAHAMRPYLHGLAEYLHCVSNANQRSTFPFRLLIFYRRARERRWVVGWGPHNGREKLVASGNAMAIARNKPVARQKHEWTHPSALSHYLLEDRRTYPAPQHPE